MYLIPHADVSMLRYERIVAITAGGGNVLVWPLDGHAELVARAHGHAVDEHEWRSPYGELISIVRYRDMYNVFLSRYRIATCSPARLAYLVAYCTATIPYAASITTPAKPAAPPHSVWRMQRRRGESWFSVALGRVTPAQRDAMERCGWRVATGVDITTNCHINININVITGLSVWPASMEALHEDGKLNMMTFETVQRLNRWAEVALVKYATRRCW